MRFIETRELEKLQFMSARSKHQRIWLACGTLTVGQSLQVDKADYTSEGMPAPNTKRLFQKQGKRFEVKTLVTGGWVITRVA